MLAMRVIVQAYASNQECSVQEPDYHCLPEFWLSKVFHGVIYANTDSREPLQNLHSQQEISEIIDENEDIFTKNILDCYMNSRLWNLTFQCMSLFRLALFHLSLLNLKWLIYQYNTGKKIRQSSFICFGLENRTNRTHKH